MESMEEQQKQEIQREVYGYINEAWTLSRGLVGDLSAGCPADVDAAWARVIARMGEYSSGWRDAVNRVTTPGQRLIMQEAEQGICRELTPTQRMERAQASYLTALCDYIEHRCKETSGNPTGREG